MLSSEVAKESLARVQNKNGGEEAWQRVKKLKRSYHDIGMLLLNRFPTRFANMRWHDPEYGKWYNDQSEALFALNDQERLTLLTAILPNYAQELEGMWQLAGRFPYQHTHSRRPFRAPTEDKLLQAKRLDNLLAMIRALVLYDGQDIRWLAAWGAYMGYYMPHTAFGQMMAASIAGYGQHGDEVLQILMDSVRGEHEIGYTSRQAIYALLCTDHPAAWDLVEALLKAAQRQEGLRQVIFESMDEGHPDVLPRFLQLILDENMVRFAATVRAVDIWFGYGFDVLTPKIVTDILAKALHWLTHPDAIPDALPDHPAAEQHVMLWALAFRDVTHAIPQTQALLHHPDPESRFIAVHFLDQLRLTNPAPILLPLLDDENLAVAVRAWQSIRISKPSENTTEDYFSAIERLIGRIKSKSKTLEALVYPWFAQSIQREDVVASLVSVARDDDLPRLIPYIEDMSVGGRAHATKLLAASPKPYTPAVREALFQRFGDRAEWVRKTASEAIQEVELAPADIEHLEGLLTRKASTLRRQTLGLLLNQRSDADVRASAERLLQSGSAPQRLAGLELLRQLIEGDRQAKQARQVAEAFMDRRPAPSNAEEELLKVILNVEREEPTLDDALGLIDPAQRTVPANPQKRKVDIMTRTVPRIIEALDKLIAEHAQTPVMVTNYAGQEVEELFGNSRWSFPRPDHNLPLKEDLQRLPLAEIWESWFAQRDKNLRDNDGLEIARALLYIQYQQGGGRGLSHYLGWSIFEPDPAWYKEIAEKLYDTGKLKPKHDFVIALLLTWFLRMHPPAKLSTFLVDATETALHAIKRHAKDAPKHDWRRSTLLRSAEGLAYLTFANADYYGWTDADLIRFWQLARFVDQPHPEAPRNYPKLSLVLACYDKGIATETDLINQLLSNVSNLRELSGKIPKAYEDYAFISPIIDRIRTRVLEVESGRGDLPTAASAAAMALQSNQGMAWLIKCIRALGNGNLHRGYGYDTLSKTQVLSHLISITSPEPDLAPDAFADAVRAANIKDKRLIEVGVYAPQWARLIEYALGWEGYTEAVFWVYAHTKGRQYSWRGNGQERWHAEIAEYTPLSSDDLLDGAVDVAWFRRVIDTLGDDRWQQVYQAAKFASDSGGHTRAQLFASAMLGSVTLDELFERMHSKRHQDTVRAIGLVAVTNTDDVLHRYEALQEFRRTSRKFGAQRQESEKLAVQIGMDNLARSAGYSDPQRLEWAMETRALGDLVKGDVVVQPDDDYTFTLAINSLGEPKFTIRRNGKLQKSLPKKHKKNDAVQDLRDQFNKLKKQGSRMRQSLEQTMVRGDTFTTDELAEVFQHPVLKPMLESLVMILEDGRMGYPIEDGRQLFHHSGTVLALNDADTLRIAHPVDLLQAGDWHAWQRECFIHERIQPFKQVFRELYVLTDHEKTEHNTSRRYAGNQVAPRQALTVLGSRGWVAHPDEGVRKTYHDAGINVWLGFLNGMYSPTEVEGLTVEHVGFSERGSYKPLPLADIPPRLFSEAMRDVDLCVSVAHVGGVDPEASASTVEMRQMLAEETLNLLSIDNVDFTKQHARIKGSLGEYSVHMGSGVVHRMPGGAVCIIPVHSQHRGRIFLPFADDDPKTAEVLSKILLLARDSQIKDPTILEQLLA